MSFILKDYGDKYGPLIRVGPNEVMFGDADTYRRINGVRSEFIKGPWYEPSRILPDQDSLFSMRDDDLRKDLKAKLAPGVRI
ncbi:putative cytochrome p450 protein [Phaeoacremonium minimum UCRPA7]|uniref:Putative cytochrome p450 protein n=1 Tax=Phaeoacremonium minimum (strain UCR-PA7) TaxID=1286976 RepID=R8BG39_PHAM7|nr:putative cytochrome p450 protein [Phaeoacremonium minimum UCRPA7]EON98252.1 putative cytochrome p450 protein [Phaeoacremonium minimum UCRPA7]